MLHLQGRSHRYGAVPGSGAESVKVGLDVVSGSGLPTVFSADVRSLSVSGRVSAVAGGFTSICCMPNTEPAIDDDGRIEFVYHQTRRANLANVFPVGAITKGRRGEELAEIALMADAGAVAFSDDGVSVASAGMMNKALAYIAMTGRVLMQHCEDPQLGGLRDLRQVRQLEALCLVADAWAAASEPQAARSSRRGRKEPPQERRPLVGLGSQRNT